MKRAFVLACLSFLALFSCARINYYKLTCTCDDHCDVIDAPETVPDNKDLILDFKCYDDYQIACEDCTIKVGNRELHWGTTYEFDEEKNQLFISYQYIEGDIVMDMHTCPPSK
ncbi:MAG: hypothetical protein MJ207_00810 [Bacilli bacterium]|nr:hypothetical protein [Bacilli bacterium]